MIKYITIYFRKNEFSIISSINLSFFNGSQTAWSTLVLSYNEDEVNLVEGTCVLTREQALSENESLWKAPWVPELQRPG